MGDPGEPDPLLDQRLGLFPLIQKIEDPVRRDRAYGAVRDAATEQDLEKYGKYLAELTGGQKDMFDEAPKEPPNELESLRRQVDTDAQQIIDTDTRIRAVGKIGQAKTIKELQKFQDRIEIIVLEQARVKTGKELVEQVEKTFEGKRQ